MIAGQAAGVFEQCAECGEPIEQRPGGRRREYCSARCRMRAKRKRDAGATLFRFPRQRSSAGSTENPGPPEPPAGKLRRCSPADPPPVPAISPTGSVANPARVIAEWARECLRVPTGPLAGQPFEIADWQEAWLRGALAPGTREAGLSIARKNGKSALVAVAALAFLVGPLNRPNWRGVCTSLTGALAAEMRDAIRQTAEAAYPPLPVKVLRTPNAGRADGLNGARLDFLAADKASGHAAGADLAIIDEGGLLPEPKRGLWAAVRSCISGRNGRFWAISVRGDGPMFDELAGRAGDPAVHWTEYAAAPDAALDDPDAWAAANPGLATGIKSASYMADTARAALANPADQPKFRSLDLNLAESPDRQMIVAPGDWRACLADELPPRDGRCVIGWDLGGSASMSAVVALWPANGRMEVWAALPDTPDLASRGQADGVGALYSRMLAAGELALYPGRVVPASQFLLDALTRLAGGQAILAIGADRFRRAEAEEALDRAGVMLPVAWRGTGASATADGSHDVRAFQAAVIAGRVRCAPSLVMTAAIAESELRFDNAGNPALHKGRQRARIDALQAAVIACGLAAMPAAAATAGRMGYAGVVGGLR